MKKEIENAIENTLERLKFISECEGGNNALIQKRVNNIWFDILKIKSHIQSQQAKLDKCEKYCKCIIKNVEEKQSITIKWYHKGYIEMKESILKE